MTHPPFDAQAQRDYDRVWDLLYDLFLDHRAKRAEAEPTDPDPPPTLTQPAPPAPSPKRRPRPTLNV